MNLNMIFTGAIIAFSGLFLSIIETAYFGWNWQPVTEAEKMWDAIILLICITGTIVVLIGSSRPKKK